MNILVYLKPDAGKLMVAVNGGDECELTSFVAIPGARGWSWVLNRVPGSNPAVYLDGFRDGNIAYSSRENIFISKNGTGLLIGETGPFVRALDSKITEFMLKNEVRTIRHNLPTVFTERREKKLGKDGKNSVFYTVQFRPFKVEEDTVSETPEAPVAGSYLLDPKSWWLIECTSTFVNSKSARGPNVWKELYVPATKSTDVVPAPAVDATTAIETDLDLTAAQQRAFATHLETEDPAPGESGIRVEVQQTSSVPDVQGDLAAQQRAFAMQLEAEETNEAAGENLL